MTATKAKAKRVKKKPEVITPKLRGLLRRRGYQLTPESDHFILHKVGTDPHDARAIHVHANEVSETAEYLKTS